MIYTQKEITESINRFFQHAHDPIETSQGKFYAQCTSCGELRSDLTGKTHTIEQIKSIYNTEGETKILALFSSKQFCNTCNREFLMTTGEFIDEGYQQKIDEIMQSKFS